MDPINILVLINIIALFGANIGGAKKGLKTQVMAFKVKPNTWLQKVPFISAFILLLQIISLFSIGTLAYTPELLTTRMAALIVYLLFSWLQILAYKSLGEFYAQDMLIMKNHKLVTTGIYKVVRHPQYMAQIIVDIAVGVALLSYLVIPIALLQIPVIIMRTLHEDAMLESYFGESFQEYKKKSGLLIPFVG